jgi:subtilisin
MNGCGNMARRKIFAGAAVFSVLLMVATCFSMATMAGNEEQKVRVIVLFKDKIDGKMVTDRGGELLGSYDNIPAVVTELRSSDINELKKNGKIKTVEEDAECWMAGEGKEQAKGAGGKPPAQPGENIEWGVKKVLADQVWTTTTGSGVSVAILDTGIDTNHPDLAANIKGGINLVNTRKTYEDDNGHGTHCAGIIAAVDNTIGVVGVAPELRRQRLLLDHNRRHRLGDKQEGF